MPFCYEYTRPGVILRHCPKFSPIYDILVVSTHPCPAARHAVDRGVVVEVALAGEREDLVLRPKRPERRASPAVDGSDAAEARRLPVEVNITDHVGDVVAVGTC